MRILYIMPYVPSRIRVRPYCLITELAKRHDVHVIALQDTSEDAQIPGDAELLGLVGSLCVVPHSKRRGIAQSLMALPTSSPMCTAFCRSGRMQKVIDDRLNREQFDVIHIEHLRAAHFGPMHSRIPVVFDAVDCLTELFAQMAASGGGMAHRALMTEEAWKLRRYEPKTIARFDHTLVTSESERDALLKLRPDLVVSVAPNGVDTEYFAPLDTPRRQATMVFSGKMSYSPNAQAAVWFARNVFPAVRDEFRSAEFVIVGSDPPAEVRGLAELPGVRVTGYVPDIRPYLGSCSVAVAPMLVAAGIQNKILEAMAMAIPVVASPIALRTFGDSCPGIISAGSSADMIRELSGLLGSPATAERIGAQGRLEVCARFSWSSSTDKIECIYEELLAGRGPGGSSGRAPQPASEGVT